MPMLVHPKRLCPYRGVTTMIALRAGFATATMVVANCVV